MIKNKIIITLLTLGALVACNKGDGYEKTPGGLMYNIISKGTGKKIVLGDIVSFHFIMKNDKDSVIQNSYTKSEMQMAVTKPRSTGSLEEGFLKLTVGDSASFKIVADTLFGENKPGFLAKGSVITLNLKVIKAQSEADFQKEANEKREKEAKEMAMQAEIHKTLDDSLIRTYIAKNNIKAEKTSSGQYYLFNKKGTGPKPAAGDSVSIHFNGKTIEGVPFDSSYNREPFRFIAGKGNTLKSWDEGILLMPKGSKATFFVPSALAFGSQAFGNYIKPYSILIFEVELVDVKKQAVESGKH